MSPTATIFSRAWRLAAPAWASWVALRPAFLALRARDLLWDVSGASTPMKRTSSVLP